MGHHSYCGVTSCGGRGSISPFWAESFAQQAPFLADQQSSMDDQWLFPLLYWHYVTSIKNSPQSLHTQPSLTRNPQSSPITCLARFILTDKKKNRPEGALDRNTAQLSIETPMHSGSEHRRTGRVFFYPCNVTSKYSQTVYSNTS